MHIAETAFPPDKLSTLSQLATPWNGTESGSASEDSYDGI